MSAVSPSRGGGPGRGARPLTAAVLTLLLALPFLAGPGLLAAEDRVVKSEGLAPVKEDDAVAARNAAIEDALRKAVEQVVTSLIDNDVATQNYQQLDTSIYSQAQGFVHKYDVLDWNRKGALFTVTISATVAVGNIRDDLSALGLLIEAMRKPRVMVIIPETNVLDHGWWAAWSTNVGTAEAAVIKALTAREFTVMDAPTVRSSIDREAALRAIEGDNTAAQRVAQQIGAEVLITGKAVAEPAGSVAGTQMNSYQATVTARAVKADTGEILGVATGSGKAVHLNATAGGREALEQAGAQVANDLLTQIAAQWAKEVSGSRMIALSISGMTKQMFDDLVALMKTRVRGVVDVYLRDFAGETGRLDVKFLGDAEQLSHALLGFQPEGGRTMVTAVTPNKLDIRYVPGAPPGE
ncbi:MAG TPA: flagellar assembly protein T N-terminal domain-containing protein [Candidatus Saccharimonadales bacterium]|nr:flagellar assembly protein T N-terminal domain-containing protein [Candidatus Saccharimonadales bacterium]